MIKFNPKIHHRRSIRLKGYDYSQAGSYFVTICIKNRHCLFGEIMDGKMILNDAGVMIEKWYYELQNKYPDIECGEFVIMPNHFHCIIINNGNTVEADLRVCPNNPNNDNANDDGQLQGDVPPIGATDMNVPPIGPTDMNVPPIGPTDEQNQPIDEQNQVLGEHDILGEYDVLGEHVGSPLRTVVQWFKTMSTNEYIRGVKNCGWKPFNGKLWQRNYWEHIIRNEQSFQRISQYIRNNPVNWQNDQLFNS